MTALSSYIFGLLSFTTQPNSVYERHIQRCSFVDVVDITWKLELKKNNSFVLSMTKQTGDVLKKPREVLIVGYWKETADTLKLFRGMVDDKDTCILSERRQTSLSGTHADDNGERFYLP